MSSNSVSPSEINAKNVSVTDPRKKKSDKGTERIVALILYKGAPGYWETPALRAPFGVNSFTKGESGGSDYSLNLSLDADDNFTKQLAKIDELMIDYGVKHSKMLFGKQYTADQRPVVEALYTPVLKPGRVDGDNHYPPRIAPKIMRDREENVRPNLLFYHSRDDQVELESFEQLQELIPKGSNVKALVAPRPWFISGRFGLSLNVLQVLAGKRKGSRPKGYAFNDDSEAPPAVEEESTSEEAEEADVAEKEESVENSESEAEAADSDAEAEEESEAEVEEESEAEEEEEVAPPPKKSASKKSAAAPARKRTTASKK
jgi:hypothetical protein